jgi:hypothetical protein
LSLAIVLVPWICEKREHENFDNFAYHSQLLLMRSRQKMIKFSSAGCGRIWMQKMMVASHTSALGHLQAFRMHNDAAMPSNANFTTKLRLSLAAKLSALSKSWK